MFKTHHLLFLGPNGSGKTTHGRHFAGLANRQYVDASRVLKIGSAFDPELAREHAHYQSQGELVPDELIFKPFGLYLGTLRHGDLVIVSGIPRILSQVNPFLQGLATHLGTDALLVADLILNPEDVVRRCRMRAELDSAEGRNPRADDLDPTIIKRRLQIHEDEKGPVIQALKEHGSEIRTIECLDDPEQMTLRLMDKLGISPSDLFFRAAGQEAKT